MDVGFTFVGESHGCWVYFCGGKSWMLGLLLWGKVMDVGFTFVGESHGCWVSDISHLCETVFSDDETYLLNIIL